MNNNPIIFTHLYLPSKAIVIFPFSIEPRVGSFVEYNNQIWSIKSVVHSEIPGKSTPVLKVYLEYAYRRTLQLYKIK